jgi:cation diffusion facilitator CzcD-associated flavoprotein CzcO
MLDWLIVGGGLHGTHLASVLVTQAGVAPARLRVLDPHERPAEAFFRMAEATGMRYLRSPSVHHIDLEPYAMRRFADSAHGRRHARFYRPYDRPGLELFRAHVEHVIRSHRLAEVYERGLATSIRRRADGSYRVTCDRGELDAKRIILGLGVGDQPCLPPWARAAGPKARVQHMFAPNFCRRELRDARSVAIVGGGISAAQLASDLARAGVAATLVARHLPRERRFDSDPGWLGPKFMAAFQRERDPGVRRRMIAEARHRGSMPPEIASELRRHEHSGRLRWVQGHIERLTACDEGMTLHIDRAPKKITAARVVLATGFEGHRPGGALLDDEAIERIGLPCAACGYPIVSPQLEWAPGLFVSGPLAELELGPSARNIAGAREAGRRLSRIAA